MTEEDDGLQTPKILSSTAEAASDEDLLNAAAEIDAPDEIRAPFMALLKEQRRRTQETTQRLKTILDSVVEGILIIDATGMIQDFNKSARRNLAGTW